MRKLIEKINTPEFFDGWTQDQNIGNASNKCCFGARIIFLFREVRNEYQKCYSDYLIARDWFYKQAAKLGWSFPEVNRAFYVAGATHLPFGEQEWRLSAKQVLQNLQKMEKPPTQNETFKYAKQHRELKNIRDFMMADIL